MGGSTKKILGSGLGGVIAGAGLGLLTGGLGLAALPAAVGLGSVAGGAIGAMQGKAKYDAGKLNELQEKQRQDTIALNAAQNSAQNITKDTTLEDTEIKKRPAFIRSMATVARQKLGTTSGQGNSKLG